MRPKLRKVLLVVVAAFVIQSMVTNDAIAGGRNSPISVGYLPAGTFDNLVYADNPGLLYGNEDPWTIGLWLATDTFTHPAALKGDPARVALAIAALDALAGQLGSGILVPYSIDGMSKHEMLQARDRVRSVLGIALSAPSQSVIDQLISVAQALEASNPANALQQLSSPVFTKPPEETLALLSNFPFLRSADNATSDFLGAVNELYYGDDSNDSAANGIN
jgi:hypothetical protein